MVWNFLVDKCSKCYFTLTASVCCTTAVAQIRNAQHVTPMQTHSWFQFAVEIGQDVWCFLMSCRRKSKAPDAPRPSPQEGVKYWGELWSFSAARRCVRGKDVNSRDRGTCVSPRWCAVLVQAVWMEVRTTQTASELIIEIVKFMFNLVTRFDWGFKANRYIWDLAIKFNNTKLNFFFDRFFI